MKQDVQDDAHAFNEYASRAVDISNGHIVDGILSFERSVRDIDQSKRRRYLYQVSVEDMCHCPPPSELNDNISIRLPGTRRTGIFRKESVDGKAYQTLEVWNGAALMNRIRLPDALHGKVISDPGGFGRPSWNADETVIVYAAERPSPPTASHFNPEPGEAIRGKEFTLGFGKAEGFGEKYRDLHPLTSLFLVDITTSRIECIQNTPQVQNEDNFGSFALGQPIFSPDGASVVYTGWDAGGDGSMPRRLGLIYCQQRPSKLYVSPISKLLERLASKEEKTDKDCDASYNVVTPHSRINRSPRFSPTQGDGLHKLVFLSSAKAFDTHYGCLELHSLDWNDGRVIPGSQDTIVAEVWEPETSPEACGTVMGLKFPGLYLLELPEKCFVSSEDLLLNTQWGSCTKIVSISLRNKEIRLLSSTIDPISGEHLLSVSMDGKFVVASKKMDMPTRIFSFDWAGGAAKIDSDPLLIPPIASSGFDALTETWNISEKLSCEIYETRCPPVDDVDKTTSLQSVLLMPNKVQFPRPALLVVPHGGPHSCSTTSYMPSYAFLCGHCGYSILLVNFRGSIGFGRGFLEALPTRIGELDVTDVLSATQDLIKSGRVDPARVGICGGSHGGFLVGHCTGQHPSIFRAAAMRNPVVNIPSMVTATDIPDWCYVEVLGKYDWKSFLPPTRDQLTAMYDKSPIRYIKDVTTPTLVALGLKDLRVPPSQGMEWYHSLRSRGIPCDLLLYDDDDHAIDGAVAEADHWINIKLWFDKFMPMT